MALNLIEEIWNVCCTVSKYDKQLHEAMGLDRSRNDIIGFTACYPIMNLKLLNYDFLKVLIKRFYCSFPSNCRVRITKVTIEAIS